MKKAIKIAVISFIVLGIIFFALHYSNSASAKSTFSEYLEGRYGEPFTIVRVFKEWHSDRGMCYRITAKSDRFDDPFVMFAYPYPDENCNHILEVNGKNYEMEDYYPEVIFQNQYLDELRPLMDRMSLMKCRIINEGSAITLDEAAAGMNIYLRDPKRWSWVTVYLLTDHEDSVTPEFTQAIQSQMESYHCFSYDLYIGILKSGETVSEEEYYKNYDTSYGLFSDYMQNSNAFKDIIHLSGGRDDSNSAGNHEDSIESHLAIINDYFDENGYWKNIHALDYVDLSKYENMELPSEETSVPQEELDRMIKMLIRPYCTTNGQDEDDIQYPELTDAFVQEHFNDQYGWNTVEDVENAYRKIIRDNARYSYIVDWLSQEVPVFEIPASMLDACSYMEVQKDRIHAQESNMSFEEYILVLGCDSLDKYLEHLHSIAEENARTSLQLQAIAETENLVLDANDLEWNPNTNSLEEKLGEGCRKMKLLQEKVRNHLIQS